MILRCFTCFIPFALGQAEIQNNSQASAGDESSSKAAQDCAKVKSREEAKSTKSKSKSGSSSSKKSSGGGGVSAKQKSMASPPQQSSVPAASNPLSSLSLPMLPPEFAQPFALPSPFSPAAQLLRPHFPATSVASSAPADQLIRLPTKPLDISEVSKNPAAPNKKLDDSPSASTKSFEDTECESGNSGGGGGGKRDNVVKVPPFSNRQRAIVFESNNNEVVGKREENGGSSTSKEQFAVLRYVALLHIFNKIRLKNKGFLDCVGFLPFSSQSFLA